MLWMAGDSGTVIRDNPLAEAIGVHGPVDSVDNAVSNRDHRERHICRVVHNPQPLLLRQSRIPKLVGTMTEHSTDPKTRRPR